MSAITGRLTGLRQEGGLTALALQDLEGEAHTVYVESGFGLRQLHDAMGGTLDGATVLTYHTDGVLVTHVTTEDNDE